MPLLSKNDRNDLVITSYDILTLLDEEDYDDVIEDYTKELTELRSDNKDLYKALSRSVVYMYVYYQKLSGE